MSGLTEAPRWHRGDPVSGVDAAGVAEAMRLIRIGRTATLDPGQFVKRVRDEDGDYERLDQWQQRAMEAAALAAAAPATPPPPADTEETR